MDCDEDKPFNPFYIGPHPSQACAPPESQGRQCSPDCLDAAAKPKEAPNCLAPSSEGGIGEAAAAIPGCAPYPCNDVKK